MGPGIGTFTYPGVFTWDTQYWTNWPGAENPYSHAVSSLAKLQVPATFPEAHRGLRRQHRENYEQAEASACS